MDILCPDRIKGLVRMEYMLVTWLLLFLMTSKSRDVETFAHNEVNKHTQQDIKTKVSIDPYSHHKLPVLKMLKRQLKHFRTDNVNNATLTLVYHSRQPVQLHWFKLEVLNGREIMYPILEDHPYYTIQYLHSGFVTAATLTIPNGHHSENHIFDTFLTTEDPVMQYQLRSILDSRTILKLHNIDSPEWLVAPPDFDHIKRHTFFERHCRAYIRKQKGGNALMLMHAPSIVADYSPRPVFTIVYQTHDAERPNKIEESGSMIMKTEFANIDNFKAVLDVQIEQTYAEKERKGLYMCAVERFFEPDTILDKLYLLSYVTFGQDRFLTSLLPGRPRVQVMTCVTKDNEVIEKEIDIQEGAMLCIKCVASGYPLPEVNITKKDRTTPFGNHRNSTRFVNLAEGMIVETIYVIQKVRKSHKGNHICSARSINGEQDVLFHIRVNTR